MKSQSKYSVILLVMGVVFAVGILGFGQRVFAKPVTDPVAASIGKAIGYAMSGQKTEAEAISNVNVHGVRSQLSGAITEKDFFLGGVIITRFDATEDGGTIQGITVHWDRFHREIFTDFGANFRGSQILRVEGITIRPVTNVQPRTAFFVVPADQIALAALEKVSFPEALQLIRRLARKAEGPHLADKTPRDYVGVVFFMEKRSPKESVELILSDKPGSVTGEHAGKTRNMKGWIMAVVPARFAYDSGPERFFNVVLTEEGMAPRAVSVYSTHSLVRRVQGALTKRGYDPGPIDGQMGRRTRMAIQAFQKDQGLHADGEHSPALLRLLTTPDLPGSVQLIQEALSRIGYDVGSIDGQMGPATKQAIQVFQKDRLLEPDGLLTAELVGMATDTAAVFPSAGEQVVSDASRRGEPEEINRYEDRRWPNRARQ